MKNIVVKVKIITNLLNSRQCKFMDTKSRTRLEQNSITRTMPCCKPYQRKKNPEQK